MNPPNTAQIVKIKLLDKVLPSEYLLSLSVTLGILNLEILQTSTAKVLVSCSDVQF